ADPETARATAEQKARERGVYIGRSDDHGTTTIVVKADTGSVIFFDATINQIADALNVLEGPAPRQVQRARAFSIMADPALSHLFLQVAQYLATHQPTTPEPPDSADAAATPATTSTPPPPTPAADPIPDDQCPPESIQNPNRLHEQAIAELSSPSPTADHRLYRADEPCWADEPDLNGEPNWHHPPVPPDPPDPPRRPRVEPLDPTMADNLITAMDTAARENLAAKLFALKTAAHNAGHTGTRPAQTKLYVHLTDETLLAGHGTMRIEGFGPAYAKLAELIGYDRVVIQPVIDLNETYNVNAYEIPSWMRERVKLTYPVEQFPYGPAETTNRTDLDHVIPYDPNGPAGQTSTTNLRPLSRRSHRIKTLAGWTEHTNGNTTEWTTPHGYKFRVDHNGTHPIHNA
ncbi:HNH endonuclease signature motif containing protein, partial [Kribbella sp. NPDC051718]|uniref:HNH endonuclease signature motif containing protein n=1 Tax=Kribbella sp. NPDC051718 TaxID=3155168 RepID=UPI0034347274